MLLRRIKAEGVLEVIHHVIVVSLGAPCKDIIIGFRILKALRVATKELF